MNVQIVIYDDKNEVIYEHERIMPIVPNIGEGILLDLSEDGGWIDDTYFCEYAICIEKYFVLASYGTKYAVCRFKGEHFTRLEKPQSVPPEQQK